MVLVCQVCPRLLVLPLEIHLTDLCVSLCHVDFGMAEDFFTAARLAPPRRISVPGVSQLMDGESWQGTAGFAGRFLKGVAHRPPAGRLPSLRSSTRAGRRLAKSHGGPTALLRNQRHARSDASHSKHDGFGPRCRQRGRPFQRHVRERRDQRFYPVRFTPHVREPAPHAGARPQYVQQQLGHETLSTTLRYYAHWIPKEVKESYAKLIDARAGENPQVTPEFPILTSDSDVKGGVSQSIKTVKHL